MLLRSQQLLHRSRNLLQISCSWRPLLRYSVAPDRKAPRRQAGSRVRRGGPAGGRGRGSGARRAPCARPPLPAPPRPSTSHAGRPSALARARAALAPSADHWASRAATRSAPASTLSSAGPPRTAARRRDGACTSTACPGRGRRRRCWTRSSAPAASSPSAATSAKNSKAAKNSTSPVRPFRFVEINALRLPTPKHVYCRLLEAMWGERASPAAAHDLLNARIGAAAAPARRGAAAKCKAKEKGGEAPRKTGATRKKSRNNDGDFDSDEEKSPTLRARRQKKGKGKKSTRKGSRRSSSWTRWTSSSRATRPCSQPLEWPARPHSGLAVSASPTRWIYRTGCCRASPRGSAARGCRLLPTAQRSSVRSSRRGCGPRAASGPSRRAVCTRRGRSRRWLGTCAGRWSCAGWRQTWPRTRRGRRGGEEGQGEEEGRRRQRRRQRRRVRLLRFRFSFGLLELTVVVSMRHVDAAVRAMFGAAHMQALSAAPLVDVLLLASLALELKASGRAAATVADLHPRVAELFASGGLLPQGSPPPSLGDVAASASRLAAQRILVADAGDARARARVALNFPSPTCSRRCWRRGARRRLSRGCLTFRRRRSLFVLFLFIGF